MSVAPPYKRGQADYLTERLPTLYLFWLPSTYQTLVNDTQIKNERLAYLGIVVADITGIRRLGIRAESPCVEGYGQRQISVLRLSAMPA